MSSVQSHAASATDLPARYVHVEHVMGTVVSVDLRDCDPKEAAAGAASAVRWLHEVDALFSTYRPDSAISRIDRGELSPENAGAEVTWVLERCAEIRRATNGYFDAWARGTLDPSALVKGWSVQRAADALVARGITDLCLTAGGDVVSRGNRASGGSSGSSGSRGDRQDGLPWRIGIQHPKDRGALAAVVHATDLAVATSGAYERGEHIVDPHTRTAPTGLLSVTVCGPDLGTADAYATAAFAMGRGAADWTLTLDGYEAMTVLDDERVFLTPGFPLADPAEESR
ncbi:FAD:protein FMN transferase [Streptomyces pseudovenezuelae]|uniref:FAD:protein FMN transferase n=1 Tax=Streptomyces pseudovenezuelae TaxID=67350 RepID=A0ABT6LSF1_9ACTN|nr:FAD:protein FMN transferase [Streptomyces pseudovenezuelae]MDH6219255.1 thiamine biosynthesis lipoprotein [Streptomyces pseudovenezuelae]